MKHFRTTRQSLIISVLSSCLCVAMLIGTTYAWFTDSVISNNNIIKSGSLDVELSFAKNNGGELTPWESVSGRSDIFDPDALWEPGRTEVVYLKVSNDGSLALQYQLSVNIIKEIFGQNQDGEEIVLSDLLVFKVVEMKEDLSVYTDRETAIITAGWARGIKDYHTPERALLPGEDDYIAIIVYMPREINNAANYRGTDVPYIELGINMTATQVVYESDSFGSEYDADCYLGERYGMLIEESTELYLDEHDFESMGVKHIDALVHVTDGSVVNIYGKTNRLISTEGLSETPIISSDKDATINIRGGYFSGKDVPILDISGGTTVNIYRGIFKAQSFSQDGDQTDKMFYADSNCEINVYGGTFVNFDPRQSHLGNLVAKDYIVLESLRDNGEIWYTVAHKDYEGYTPVFSFDEVMEAFNNKIDNVLVACDLDAPKDTEMLLRGVEGEALVVDGMGALLSPDGTGTNPDAYDYGYIGFIPYPGDDAYVSNFNFTGKGFVEVSHHKEGGGTYVVTNVTITDLNCTFHVNNGGNDIAPAFSHYGTATLKDCVMTGSTTEKVGYKPYDAAFVNGTKTFIQGGKYGYIYMSHQAHVTLEEGADVDSIDCYSIISGGKALGKLTVKAGAKVGTIYVLPGGYKPSVVIEEGAEVGEIIYNGVSYTAEEWIATYQNK